MSKKKAKKHKVKEKRMAAIVEDFNGLLDAVDDAVQIGQQLKEPAPPAPQDEPSAPEDQAKKVEAWYQAELRKRVFLMERLNTIAESVGAVASALNSKMQVAPGYPDLTPNKPVLSSKLDAAVKIVKADLGAAFAEVKQILEPEGPVA